MKLLDRGVRLKMAVLGGLSGAVLGAVLATLCGAPASAQENLYGNKTPAQIFASDCAICHKTPQGLSKAGGSFGFGLESFLREHYTASRESAAVLAKYIQTMDSGPAAPDKGTRRTGAKPAAKKGADDKPTEAKAGDAKPADGKPAEAKPEAKPEPKVEAKPEAKPAEAAKPEKSN